MSRHRWSLLVYRSLLRIYPSTFRARFAADLEADFAQMLDVRGARAAWGRAIADFWRALPLTHAHDQRTRQRHYAVTLGGESHMGSLLFDVRHAVRALAKSPVFTAVTVLTLALGIGANSAIFSLVNAVLLRPLGYHAPERLMMIHEIIPESKVPRFGVSPADYLDLDQYQSSFTDIGVYRTRSVELSGSGDPETIVVAETSAAVFPLLGVGAAEGRTFLPAEDQSEQSVVVITDGLRRRRYAASSPIGERITLDRRPYTIVGVMPAGFEFPKRGPQFNSVPADAFMPLVFNPFERQARGMFYNHSVIGRLRDGVSLDQATSDTAALAAARPRELSATDQKRLQAADCRVVVPRRDRGRGAPAAPDPARRRRPRAARGLREHRQPLSQSRRLAAARDRRARGARRGAPPLVPDADGRKPDDRCRRRRARTTDRASGRFAPCLR